MATATPHSLSLPSRPTYSCMRCADRRVKCDRQRPCGACVKHNADCLFNTSRPPRKKRQILTDRLRHYEALLQQQGIDTSKLPDSSDSEARRESNHTVAVVSKESHLETPSSVESELSQCLNKTQVVHGKGRSQFVDNSLWTRVVEEFNDPKDALEDSSDDGSDSEVSDKDFGFVLSIRPKPNKRSYHPPPERIHQLWQIFTENFDPLTKIVHVPTLRLAVQKAASDVGTLPRSFEALMFAIYGAAVMSLKDDECKKRLGEHRKMLLARYISATKAALSRAKFMSTINLVVLQALVIHLLSVRDISEPRAVWSLTGVAVRIAQAMGLDRDGVSLGLPPFETEVRRRIWWLLKTHDFRAAELCGLAKFRDLDTVTDATKWPTNINDDQLYPGMSELPAESKTLTDVGFICFRYELVNFVAARITRFRQQGLGPSQWDLHASGSEKVAIDEAARELEEVFETKYLRYCDPSQPLHLMIMLGARYSINGVRFLTHHPRRWASIEQTPLSERRWVWEVSNKLLEQYNMFQSNPQIKQFAWHAAYFLQWHALIHILDVLRANPLEEGAEKTWQLVSNAYENNIDMVFDTRRPIHVAVGNLCLKAYSSRETALQNGGMFLPPTPQFIMQLRQQREVAKAKKQARDAKSSSSQDPVSHNQANTSNMDPRLHAGIVNPSDTLESTHFEQSITSPPQSHTKIGGGTDDPFWLINGFDDSQVVNSNGVMDMDLDFMLAQDHSAENNATQTINWEEWDAWLAESNVIRPISFSRDSRAGT